jgi:hypothetical protein
MYLGMIKLMINKISTMIDKGIRMIVLTMASPNVSTGRKITRINPI